MTKEKVLIRFNSRENITNESVIKYFRSLLKELFQKKDWQFCLICHPSTYFTDPSTLTVVRQIKEKLQKKGELENDDVKFLIEEVDDIVDYNSKRGKFLNKRRKRFYRECALKLDEEAKRKIDKGREIELDSYIELQEY